MKSFIRTENVSNNMCPIILQQIREEVCLIVDQFKLPNTMLQVYYQLLNNIKKNLISTPKDQIKQQLRYLKFEVPLKFFKLQDSKLDSNGKLNYEQKLKLLNLLERFTMNKNTPIEKIRSTSNKITIEELEMMIKVAVFNRDIKLQSFSDQELNKTLLNSYNSTLSKYADHKYIFSTQKKSYFLKFMHPEAFCLLQFNQEIENESKIYLNFHIICLKCFKENLGKILSLIQQPNFDKLMKDLQENLDCKFRNQIKNSDKINNYYTGKMLSNLQFLFQIDFNLFFKKKLQNEQNFSKIYSELNKSSTSTDDLSQSLTFTKILSAQINKGFYFSDQLIDDLKIIFNSIYDCFFTKINFEEKSQKGYYYLLNTNENIIDFSILSCKINNSPVIRSLQTNLATFISYLKQITSNINFFLIQIQLHVQKNHKICLNEFKDIMDQLKNTSCLDNTKIQFFFSKNFVKKKDNKLSEEIYQQIKLSSQRNEFLKNKYYYNIYYTSFYIYEFDVIRKKLSKIIMSVLESFFSCVYLELFLLNPIPTNDNSYKMLCKNLEKCRQIFIINYQNLPNENFSLGDSVYKRLKKMNKYVLEIIGKKRQNIIKGISIIPKKTNDKFVLNYVFKKTKVEILIYESLTWDQQTLQMCAQCKNFLNCLQSEPKTTYFNILQKILTFSYIQQYDQQNSSSHSKFSEENQCCIQLCKTIEDILNIIYEKNAKNLLEKILYNKIKGLNKYLENANQGFQNRQEPFLKIIDIKKLNYMKFEENINLYESLIHDNILEIYRKEDNIFFRIIEGDSYLLKIEKDDHTEMDTQTQIILIYFYGVKNDKSINHIEKIFDQIKERVNNILRQQILKFLPHITLMNQNLKIIKNIYYNYYDHKFSIKIPKISKTILVLYFSQNLQRYFNPIQGQLDNQNNNDICSFNVNLNELNIKNEKINKYFIIPQTEDFQFLSKVDQNRMIKDESIFLLNIKNIQLPFLYNKYFDTRDEYFIHDLFYEDIQTKELKQSDFFQINEKQLCLRKKKFYQLENDFELVYKHQNNDNFIDLSIQTQKQNSSEDKIVKKIYNIMKFSFFDYYIELIMSLHFIKDKNIFPFKKSFIDFIQFIIDFKDQKKEVIQNSSSNFQYEQINNTYFQTYIFQSFLETTQIITQKFGSKDFSLKIYYIYQNQGIEDDIQIIESDYDKFVNDMQYYFEEREQLFKRKELDFTLLIVPGGIQFDIIENNFKNYIQSRKQRYKEDNILLSNSIDISSQRQSMVALNRSSAIFRQKQIQYQSFSLNKNSIKKSKTSGEHQDDYIIKNEILKEYKTQERQIYRDQQVYDYKKQNTKFVPPRRFFLLMKFSNKKVDLFSYNIKKKYIQEILDSINSYMNLTRLKNELQKYISLQKLGINNDLNISQYNFENSSVSYDYYQEKIQEAQSIDLSFKATHFTDIIQLVFKEGVENKGLMYLIQDELFIQKILRDFSKIQFNLINAYKSSSVNLIAFHQQRTKEYTIDNLMFNFCEIAQHYFKKRIFEERLKQTLTITNQNFGNLNYFIKKLETIYEIQFPFFYMDYYYFKNKSNDDIQSFSEVIQKEKSINVQRNIKRLIYIRWKKKVIQIFQIRKELKSKAQYKIFRCKQSQRKFQEILLKEFFFKILKIDSLYFQILYILQINI